MRTLKQIALEINVDWTNINAYALPYLNAMYELESINDSYYHDSAKSVVLYFLSNATTWKGETAREIKKELKKLCQ